ncbi:arsenosugar biosynthesis radical SAM (seleno)protein ArsS [Campylobacter geochelonis]|uniref:Molybdenum cofactor biosynthesis protein A n=1 Tax=Campylobacter geochelonis TaxID=1780362 RepID=A0A128EAC5_9BACT|nr:arsenosugar biosynthesis radical SAM (seleno)protein ArsS [Campylobacter geochelonis]QKF70599.1 radical SAM/Cys-rich domain protein [Campylobacter geochelonis]CZE45956.1 molybdenum cofactor biosynthesis protein A [Campylobacter geochelonis]
MIPKIYSKSPKTMQLNITKKCNMSCYHCHVGSSPNRTEMMSKDVMEACLSACEKFGFSCIDITGGAPEMNENLEFLLQKAHEIGLVIMLRSNLTILLDEKYSHFMQIYAKYGVIIIASVPFYEEKFNDSMRGKGSFTKELEAIKRLNLLGFGDSLKLNLVYNPNGAYLPAEQNELEKVYKKELAKFGIKFNSLFCMANVAIGRFGDMLKKFDEYDEYVEMLKDSLNLENLENLMCVNGLNVQYDGSVYDCDFNAALGLGANLEKDIFALLKSQKLEREVVIKEHCYACMAGDGYGCYGSLK